MFKPGTSAQRSTGVVPLSRSRGGSRVGRLRFVVAFVVVAAAAAFAAWGLSQASGRAAVRTSASAVPRLAGTWQLLPAAPIVPGQDPRFVSVWTGKQMFVFARVQLTAPWSVNAAATYSPTTNTWRRLTPPPGPGGNFEGVYTGVWTGKEVLVVGPTIRHAFNPVTNRWRRLPPSKTFGFLVVWTGREMIGWGGGCCGDASAAGGAYNPATNAWRTLPRAPLAPSQGPGGAWTGRELIILVSGLDPDQKPYPARFARAAAYNPATNTWHRIAPQPLNGGHSVWDGRELLVAGAGRKAKATLAYNPATNHWRLLAPMPYRAGGPAVWTRNRLMIWRRRDGLAYNPHTNRWTATLQWPFQTHDNATMLWTGRALIVWAGGGTPSPKPADGATFTPTRP